MSAEWRVTEGSQRGECHKNPEQDAGAWTRAGAMGLRGSSSGLGLGGPGRRRKEDSRGSGLGKQVANGPLSEMETLGGR